MKKKAIIFGHTGQDGFYLTQLLQKQDIEVIGISRSLADYSCNLLNYEDVKNLISDINPHFIFHFAAVSKTSHDVLFNNFESITIGTLNILEAVYHLKTATKIFISGSGLQFKNNDQPIKETDTFEANDSYSMCRIQSAYTTRYYRSLGMQAYMGYFFNHDSPLRAENHMTQKLLQAAKRIHNGSKEKIMIGDLEACKEYGYAGDIVAAVWTLVNQDEIYEATLGTGIAYPLPTWLDTCFSHFKLDWKDYVIHNPDYQPPYKILVSDNSTIKSLGWSAKTDLQELKNLMLK